MTPGLPQITTMNTSTLNAYAPSMSRPPWMALRTLIDSGGTSHHSSFLDAQGIYRKPVTATLTALPMKTPTAVVTGGAAHEFIRRSITWLSESISSMTTG